MSMSRHICRALVGLTIVVVTLAACSGEHPPGRKDTTAAGAPPSPGTFTPTVTLAAVWDTIAGSFFALSGDNPSTALLIDPVFSTSAHLDTLRLEPGHRVNAELDLLLRGDSVRYARIVAVHADTLAPCAAWPVAELRRSDAQPLIRPWSIAFPHNRAIPLPFDSLPALSGADSLELTIALARAASIADIDTASVFRGRPYIVRQANRFRLADGDTGVLAEVARIVNQEANPLQEQLVLVLEGRQGDPKHVLTVGYTERTVGYEESLESLELLGILQLRNGAVALLVRREIGDGFRLELLEREAPSQWVRRWRSAYAGC